MSICVAETLTLSDVLDDIISGLVNLTLGHRVFTALINLNFTKNNISSLSHNERLAPVSIVERNVFLVQICEAFHSSVCLPMRYLMT